jgi:hypothetical protein
MLYSIDIWLRGTDYATTREGTTASEPAGWTDADVESVLKDMLRAVDREKNPKAVERPVFLRGFSWIVNPYQDGGVVIAIELQAGAAVAGPFDIDRRELEQMVTRVMTQGQVRPGVQ